MRSLQCATSSSAARPTHERASLPMCGSHKADPPPSTSTPEVHGVGHVPRQGTHVCIAAEEMDGNGGSKLSYYRYRA